MFKHGKALSSILALIAFLALTACSQESEEEQPGTPTQEEESFQDSTGGGSA
ncbi:fimbrillin family protein [Modicisalibacter luteus]|uniref:Fimbrillin family protein n=1 Tax=Modicisalibacter luteus TaxID=453962 RepID=A0ABV7LYQ9_9GAMM|nr:fimbrillin family protein [Halomonas lutea]GHA95298.1 hypothetical protein GCM10007159_15900 [Halomonas lutea]